MSAKQRIKDYRDAIKDLSQWRGSKEVFGYIDGDPGNKVDYIYEFYCGMCLLKDLSKQHRIVAHKRNGKIVFPKKPGAKANYSYFKIYDKGGAKLLNQFCFGTKIFISGSPSTNFSSDLSIQKDNASDIPSDKDVVIILDAKYSTDKDSKLSVSTIREFAQCRSDMGTPKNSYNQLIFTDYNDLNSNCLITNCHTAEKHKQYCMNNKIKQIGKFDYDQSFEVVG